MFIAMGNAIAVYFLLTYRVILDKPTMGNVLNTDLVESSEYLHPTLIVYALVLGVVPCWLLVRVRIRQTPRSRLAAVGLVCLSITVSWCLLALRTGQCL